MDLNIIKNDGIIFKGRQMIVLTDEKIPLSVDEKISRRIHTVKPDIFRKVLEYVSRIQVKTWIEEKQAKGDYRESNCHLVLAENISEENPEFNNYHIDDALYALGL
jgi:hypothetical protein